MNFNNIRKFLRQDRIEETLEELDSYTQQYNKSYRDEVLLLSARFNALNRDIHLRIISDEDRQRHANVIRYDATELINSIENWAQGRPELAPEESQLEDELEMLAAQFEETNEQKITSARLRMKNDLLRKIGDKFIQRPSLVAKYENSGQEAILAGIALKIKMYPSYQDLDVLESLAEQASGNFARGVMANALAELIYSGQLSIGDDRRVIGLLERLELNSDVPLQKNVERVRAALEYLLGTLPEETDEILFYDDDVRKSYQRLLKKARENTLTLATFILTLSALFDRGTFRLEPCIRECNTQLWDQRWTVVFETNRFISIFLDKIRGQLEIKQRRLLAELQHNLFKYQDAMGGFLFEDIVDKRRIDDYLQNKTFPKGKHFKSPAFPSAEEMPPEMIKAINRPLQKSIVLVDDLLESIEEPGVTRESLRCEECIC